LGDRVSHQVNGDDPRVSLTRTGSIATVTIDTPRRKNAIGRSGWLALHEAIRSLELGRDRVLVVTGAGTDFCSGADLSEPPADEHPSVGMDILNAACLALHRTPAVTIARVDGVAVGAGANLALACDFVIASERARFSEIFVRRGLSVDFGGSWLLPRLVGLRRAKELVLLGDMLPAAEALTAGLVNRVVPPEELDAEVDALADRLARNPPVAAAASKRMLGDAFDVSLQRALDDEAANQSINLAMDDAREARDAFLAKREPVFRGR
jgi:enoyl-CoA hydratase/carnithine racemase